MKEQVVNAYKQWYDQHGDSPRALGYGSERSQTVRFEQMLKIADFTGKNVLDVGCGFGDFAVYLEQRANMGRYVGVDICEHNIVVCEKKHEAKPQWQFFFADFLEFTPPFQTDIAICSGSLNAGVDFDTAKNIIDRMWKLSSEGIIFNLENNYGFPEEKRIKLYDPLYWLGYVHEHFSYKVVYFADYHTSDFTIGVFK